MHCADPGCLKACPSPGAIVQYANGIVDFSRENCIGCGYCVKGCPFNIPRISQGRSQGLQVHAVLRPRRRRAGAGLREGLPDRRDRVRHQEGHAQHAGERIEDLKSRGFENAGLYDPPGVGGTHVMYVLHHADQPAALRRTAAGAEDQPDGRPVEGRRQAARPARASSPRRRRDSCTTSRVGRNETDAHDEEAARRELEKTPWKPSKREERRNRPLRVLHPGEPLDRGDQLRAARPVRAWRCSTRRCSG
jgi:formate dehydrogenase iron-sulfur subunit